MTNDLFHDITPCLRRWNPVKEDLRTCRGVTCHDNALGTIMSQSNRGPRSRWVIPSVCSNCLEMMGNIISGLSRKIILASSGLMSRHYRSQMIGSSVESRTEFRTVTHNRIPIWRPTRSTASRRLWSRNVSKEVSHLPTQLHRVHPRHVVRPK